MSKIVVYWSGTGNTKSVAEVIAADTNALVKEVSSASVDEVLSNNVIILGCPAMGAEELEDMEFQPFYDELISKITNQKIFLFGSYGWGDGEWMRNWEADVISRGANMPTNGLIINGDASALDDSYQSFIEQINE